MKAILFALLLVMCGAKGHQNEAFHAQMLLHGYVTDFVSKAIITEHSEPVCAKSTFDLEQEISVPMQAVHEQFGNDSDSHLKMMISHNSAIYKQMIADSVNAACRNLYVNTASKPKVKRYLTGVATTVAAISRIYTDFKVYRALHCVEAALERLENDWNRAFKDLSTAVTDLLFAAHRNEIETELLIRLSMIMERVRIALHDLFEENRLPIFTNATEILKIFGDLPLGPIYQNDPEILVHMAEAVPLRCAGMKIHFDVCLPVLTSEMGSVHEIHPIGSFEEDSSLYVTPLLNYSFVFLHSHSSNPYPVDISLCQPRGNGMVCPKKSLITSSCHILSQGENCNFQIEEAPERFTKVMKVKSDIYIATRVAEFSIMKKNEVLNTSEFAVSPFIGKVEVPLGQKLVVGNARIEGNGAHSRISLTPAKVARYDVADKWQQYIYGVRNFTTDGKANGHSIKLSKMEPAEWQFFNEPYFFVQKFQTYIAILLCTALFGFLLLLFCKCAVCFSF